MLDEVTVRHQISPELASPMEHAFSRRLKKNRPTEMNWIVIYYNEMCLKYDALIFLYCREQVLIVLVKPY